MRTPREVDIEITARCNLRCVYCYYFDNPSVSYRDLPTDEWLRFFDELGAAAVMSVTLAGGEPFTRKDLPVLLEGLVRNRIRYSLLSNGGLITDEMANFVAQSHRCDYVQVSIDGGSAEVHDAIRGRGSFVGAVRGIQTLQRHGVRVVVRVTVAHQNVHDLSNTIAFLLDELGIESLSTNSASNLGSCRVNSDVQLDTEDRERAMVALLALCERYPGRISAAAGPLANAWMWRRMEQARQRGEPGFDECGYLTACGCASSKISVRADGIIVPCAMLAQVELGRINQDRFVDVWRTSPPLVKLRERRSIPLGDFEMCSGCPYIAFCTGNCPALAFAETGIIDHPSPDACLRLFLRDGGKLPGSPP